MFTLFQLYNSLRIFNLQQSYLLGYMPFIQIKDNFVRKEAALIQNKNTIIYWTSYFIQYKVPWAVQRWVTLCYD